MDTADAIVVGGGIVGASAMFHLCSLGLSRVVLCERREPGAGASGASGGFIQFHFCQNEPETRLTLASLPYFERWDELVGAGSCGFVAPGYLRLEPAGREEVLRARVAMLRGLGVDSRVITPGDVARLAPYLRLDDVAIAAYEPGSGYADANQTLAGFLAAARRAGGEVRTETTVTRLRVEGAAIAGVETTAGPLDAPIVVVAAGAWTNDLLRGVGLDLPLIGALTQWIGLTPASAPPDMMTVGDGVSLSYFRRHEGGILIGLGGGGRLPLGVLGSAETAVPAEIVQTARQRLGARLVGAENAGEAGGRSGPITLTPDDLPIIDRHPEVAGLYFFAGDCGSSFKTAPAIGRALAEWALHGRTTTTDVSAFGLGRFAAPIA